MSPAHQVLPRAVCASEPLVTEGTVGLYLTAISVIIVYHLFALQTWLATVDSMRRVVTETERNTVSGDLKREDLIDELDSLVRGFPFIQILGLGIAASGLSALAIAAAVEASIPFLYGGTPTLIMAAVYVASSVACFSQGRRRLREMRALLAPGYDGPR